MDRKNIHNGTKIESLENSLYKKNAETTRIKTSTLHDIPVSVQKDWVDTPSQAPEPVVDAFVPPKHNTFFKKFFISSFLFLLVAVGLWIYTFFIKSKINPEGSIVMSVIGSTFTKAGDSLPLTIEIENKNDFDLEIVDLIVAYPRDGEKPTASLEDTERERISIGTIPKNQKILKEVQLTLFGNEGDQKEVHFTLEYSISNSSAIFQKEKIYAVTLSSSPIIARILAPTVAVPNQLYRFTLEVGTNTQKPLENILLAVQYPTGFVFKSASQDALSQNNIWDLGTITPGTPKQIEIEGVFSGVNGDERSLRALVGTYKEDNRTTIRTNLGTLIQTVLLQKPFLSTDLFVNGSGEDTVVLAPAETVQGQIKWKNNLENQVFDLEIQVKLKGALFNRDEIEATDGFYNSQTDTLVWNKNTMDSFVRVPAKAEGILTFTIPTRKPYTDGSEKNPKLNFDVIVKGLEDTEGTTPKTIESLEQVVAKIGGDISFFSQARYKTGQFVNAGYPPKVNNEVTYTAVFTIDNPVNQYYKGEMRAKLPPNVVYKNVFYPESEKVTYDEKTDEIIWRIGEIDAIGAQSKTLSLQLHVIPSLSQINKFVPLLNDVVFKAFDKFTNKQVIKNNGTLTNEIKEIEGEDPEPTNGHVIK